MREAERESAMSARRSNQSGKSRSSRCSKNSYSSSYSEKSRSIKAREIEGKAKVAELQAKIQFLEQRQRAENQAEALKVHKEMAGAKARMEVYKSYDEVSTEEDSIPPPMKEKTLEFGQQFREDGKYNQKEILRFAEENFCSRLTRLSNRRDADEGQIAMMQSNEVRRDVQSTKINMQMDRAHNATLEQRTKDLRSSKDGNQSETDDGLTGMMCKLLSQQSAPNVDIDVFDGNPLEFNYFMSIFEEMVESKGVDPRGRLTRLINYTNGEAKEFVKHCIQQPTEVCYDNAKNLLMRRYGDPHKILWAYRLEIKKWPQVRQGDAAAYRKFYNFLLKCQSLTDGRKWNLFNSPDMLCTLISKLPMSVGDRSNRRVQFTRKNQLKEPGLTDFIKFVKEETELVNDPLYSREAVDQHTERKERERRASARGIDDSRHSLFN